MLGYLLYVAVLETLTVYRGTPSLSYIGAISLSIVALLKYIYPVIYLVATPGDGRPWDFRLMRQ